MCKNVDISAVMNIYFIYRYLALGPVWAETRAQSGNWYGSGTLHPGQVLRGSLPLLSPAMNITPLMFDRPEKLRINENVKLT